MSTEGYMPGDDPLPPTTTREQEDALMECVCGATAEEGTEGWEWRRDGEYRHGMRYCPDCAEKDRTEREPTLAELRDAFPWEDHR